MLRSQPAECRDEPPVVAALVEPAVPLSEKADEQIARRPAQLGACRGSENAARQAIPSARWDRLAWRPLRRRLALGLALARRNGAARRWRSGSALILFGVSVAVIVDFCGP